MLPKKYRLADRQMFKKALAKGARVNGKFFVLASLAGADLPAGRQGQEGPKIGAIISGKISKKAVVRNKIKRILYDSVKEVFNKIPKEAVLVFLAKRQASIANKKEIEEDVNYMLAKGIVR